MLAKCLSAKLQVSKTFQLKFSISHLSQTLCNGVVTITTAADVPRPCKMNTRGVTTNMVCCQIYSWKFPRFPQQYLLVPGYIFCNSMALYQKYSFFSHLHKLKSRYKKRSHWHATLSPVIVPPSPPLPNKGKMGRKCVLQTKYDKFGTAWLIAYDMYVWTYVVLAETSSTCLHDRILATTLSACKVFLNS